MIKNEHEMVQDTFLHSEEDSEEPLAPRANLPPQ
jgi:hypothetical protein